MKLFADLAALCGKAKLKTGLSSKDPAVPMVVTTRGRSAIAASLLLATITAMQCTHAIVEPLHGLSVIDMFSLAAAATLLAYFGITATPRAAFVPVIGLAQHRLSGREPLTPAASRWKFDSIAAERLGRGIKCVILLIDIDDFGHINDQHGYGCGDSLLLLVSDRLRRATPAADAVAHLFSDKFGVLACGLLEPNDPQALALHLVRAFNEPFFFNDTSLRISVSIGIAEAPSDGAGLDDLMKAASEALRSAKSSGGGVWSVYTPAMQHNKNALRRALPDAIVNREIVPHYQPIVDLTSGQVVGLEVLARWYHPTLGLLLPDAFIPVADEAGMLSDITISLLRDVADDARAWPDALFFSINITPNQLQDIIDFAHAAPDLSSLPFHRIEMELTESDRINDLEATRELVRTLRDLGARVVLDDFGIGHSNFYHLCTIPFDRIKIDKTFVFDLLTDTRADICVRSIVQAAVSLQIDVVAEGVATPEIAARIIQLGCKFGQGSLFSMPVPAKEVPAFLERLGATPSAPRTGLCPSIGITTMRPPPCNVVQGQAA